MKGETSASRLFPPVLKSSQRRNVLAGPGLILAWPRVGARGWGQPSWFLARSCFYNSLSTDLCPHTGLSWEFLRRSSLDLRN